MCVCVCFCVHKSSTARRQHSQISSALYRALVRKDIWLKVVVEWWCTPGYQRAMPESERKRAIEGRDAGGSQLGQTVTHSQPANSTAVLEKKFLIVFHSRSVCVVPWRLAASVWSVFLDLSIWFFFFFSSCSFPSFSICPLWKSAQWTLWFTATSRRVAWLLLLFRCLHKHGASSPCVQSYFWVGLGQTTHCWY